MTEENKRITNYLKKAVLAQVDKGIDFKNEEFYRISQENLITGNIEENITTELFEKNKKEIQNTNDEENIDENLYVILAAKVIKTQVEGTQKKDNLESLTGIFFMPAMLNKSTSSLLPAIEENKLPWFPREVLKPMIEPELAIGDSEIYDEVVSDGIYNIYKIINWQEYINYCKNIYEKTTKCNFESNEIYNMNAKKEKIQLEDNAYIFLDKTINPSKNIEKLYNDITNQNIQIPLYENFIELKQANNKQLLENTKENKKLHYGQMGGKYGLSPSQRESLNHFNNMNNGEILAIQGPPGTGKTTLLQSVLASEYVRSALEEKDPPLIVAASTNNQAVTNIIDSFGKITTKYNNNLETRWIEKVNSFAIYFPSKQKMKFAKQKGFLYTNNKGEYSILEIDSEENIEKSKEKYLNEAEKLFPNMVQNRNIEEYKEIIHQELLNINIIQNKLINIVQELEELTGNETPEEILEKEKENIQRIKEKNEQNVDRLIFWQNRYKQIPKLWKILSFIKKYKIKISNNLKIFLNEDENFEKSIIDIELIESYYANKTGENNLLIRKINQKIEKINQNLQAYKNEIEKLKKYNIDNSKIISNKDELDIWLDTNIRYISFWLSVHYYEARWLEGNYSLTSNQRGKTFRNVLINFYKRLSMITPCMVMTFYMLPKQFEAYKDEYLYNIIDTLIVDEAGQVSTEIAACSFALAKKAIVVGDDKQIEPVWGVERVLDKSLAIQEKVILNEDEFERLENSGITSSNSSVMKTACKATNYSKYGEKGLFLSEHRRCYDDIIQYCNELVYKGQLNPLRGNGNEVESILPKMGYYQIDSIKSKRVGTSRNNTLEAVKIAKWILENAEKIFEFYSNTDKDKIIGIITPFKEQANEIKRVFKQLLPLEIKDKITVGTIHVFQGGERKVIIMSTTYGSEDGCFFIDHNKNIMNVAVSRAEDSFLVFGNINCLKDDENSPSGLLKKYIIKKEKI